MISLGGRRATIHSVEGPAGPRGRPGGERGHLLIVLMVGVAVMLIMMTVAAQSWTFRIRREMEAELIFRGEQYVKGLQRYREATGGFPLGDLKVLVNKTPAGERFMRKLYRNPFHEKGEWQYLFLHPGGSGFINPCAKLTAPAAFAASGQLPIAGMQMMGGDVVGGMQAAGTSRRGGRGRGRAMFGGGNTGEGDPGSLLSAMDPETFKTSGVSGMNLPIVGVVNCEQVESIRTYQAQTWMANWAFTPLAQGEFGGKAMGGGSGAHNVSSGLGLFGAQSYSARDAKGVPNRFMGLDDDNRPSPGRHRPPSGGGSLQQGAGDDEGDQDRPTYQWRRDREQPAGDEDRADDRDEETSDEETPRQRRRGRGTPAKTDPNDKTGDDDGESDEEQDPNFIDEDGDGEEDSSEEEEEEGEGDGEGEEDDDGDGLP